MQVQPHPDVKVGISVQFTFSEIFLSHERFVKCFTYFDMNMTYLGLIWIIFKIHAFKLMSF